VLLACAEDSTGHVHFRVTPVAATPHNVGVSGFWKEHTMPIFVVGAEGAIGAPLATQLIDQPRIAGSS
jgi:hypothetical protein